MSGLSRFALSVQWADPRHRPHISRHQLRRWVLAALEGKETGLQAQAAQAQITLRVVDEEEGRDLARYRSKEAATNVLTFVYNEGAAHAGKDGGFNINTDQEESTASSSVWADVVLCAPVVAREASAQGIEILAHYAHLVVHGVLHAQGYDHENAPDAEVMEALEARILAGLGFANPYAVQAKPL